MNRILFAAVFLLGASAIAWIGSGYSDSHLLALTVTAVIGAVYAIGCVEMLLYRRATASLTTALTSMKADMVSLDDWLEKLHASLQTAVRLRIEGERIALPGPALTPYLVGLLVMLGMLGTFVGMVVTLNGAVFALEGTTDLQAIRAGLAAPIKGLGLAFGTSVAGVAASAMLGLISTLSRRERNITAQLLDRKIATVLRGFSLAHHRQETFRALQSQAGALPEVVDKLQAMAVQMERMGNHLNDRLMANQESFHASAKGVFADLARSVETSLKESLSASGRLAGESLKPMVAEAMAGISREAQNTHKTLIDAAGAQMDGFSERFGQTAKAVADHWQGALVLQERGQDALLGGLHQSLQAFNETFATTSANLQATLTQSAATLHADQASADQQRLTQWQTALASVASAMTGEWKLAGEHTLAHQQQILASLQATATAMASDAQNHAHSLLDQMTQLLRASEQLLRERMATEENWTREAQNTHEKLINASRTQLEGFAERFNAAAGDVAQRWQEALAHHQQSSNGLVKGLERSLEAFNTVLSQQATAQLSAFQEASDAARTAQRSSDQQRLTEWSDRLSALADTLKSQWQQAGENTLSQQQAICKTLESTAHAIAEHSGTTATRVQEEISRLLGSSDALIQSRMNAEDTWLKQHAERMDQLTLTLRTELGFLRDEEATRGKAAVEQLATLQSALASHLATLGTALEAPMARLIETASEAPRAAAEVIAQLRAEISNNIARDNQLLEERQRIMESLDTLLTSLNQSSAEQRAAIDTLVTSSTEKLHALSSEFTAQVSSETGKLSDIAAQVTGGAVEVSSLSEAFGFAVQRFGEANEKLIDNLGRIEAAMNKSTERSDEQLAYYVAQAREIIDLSMLSQKEIFEELRQLQSHKEPANAEVN